MDYVWVALGLALLVVGGEILLRGALGLSVRLGLAPAVIGAVVVGFGTSTPELAASITAALADAPGIALGNVIGSNVANIALILGVTVVISPIVARIGRMDAVAFVLATLAAIAVILMGGIGLIGGVAMIIALAAFIGMSLRQGTAEEVDTSKPALSLWASLGLSVVGLALLIGGAQALVTGAVSLAEAFGVPPAIIGLTVVAIGTSLPELAASLSAALRGQGAMALGNVVGSNIFNVFGILGVTALVHPIASPEVIGLAEIVVLAVTAAALLALGLWGRIGRIAGLLGLAVYAAYVAVLVA